MKFLHIALENSGNFVPDLGSHSRYSNELVKRLTLIIKNIIANIDDPDSIYYKWPPNLFTRRCVQVIIATPMTLV